MLFSCSSNESTHFKKCKQLIEYQHLLLLRDIWWKFIIYILMLFIFSTPVLIRHLRQPKTVVFLHWCVICAVLLNIVSNISLDIYAARGLVVLDICGPDTGHSFFPFLLPSSSASAPRRSAQQHSTE
jgi:hypothetical protein